MKINDYLTKTLIIPVFVLSASFSAYAETPVNALLYSGPAWSPYIVGVGIGILSWFTFYFSDKPIGASSFYAMLAGLMGRSILPKHTDSLEYFKQNPPRIGWEVIFILATIAGGFLAAWQGGEITNEWIPPFWSLRFGGNVSFRGLIGFLGGILMAFGARLAGGCTSGNGISGTMQLSLGSWVAVIAFFIGGIVVAVPFYLW